MNKHLKLAKRPEISFGRFCLQVIVLKKVLLLLALILPLTFCSCNKNEGHFTVEPFEAHVEAESGGSVLTGHLKYVSPDCISITVEKPENLKKLTIGTQDGSDFISIGSMNFVSVPNDIFGGESNVIEVLFDALGSFKDGFSAKNNKTVSVSADGSYGKCVLRFNTEKNSVETLDAGRYKFIFSEVTNL